MLPPTLFDACTLRNFGVAGRLDVLEARCGHLPLPRWTETVAREIENGRGSVDCNAVLACVWLGDPCEPEPSELRAIFDLQKGMNLGLTPERATLHLGEAESLYFAKKLGAAFVTDDNLAFDQAEHALGLGRVRDTVSLLRDAVAMEDISQEDAHLIANAIRNSDRDLRRVHPHTLPRDYFLAGG